MIRFKIGDKVRLKDHDSLLDHWINQARIKGSPLNLHTVYTVEDWDNGHILLKEEYFKYWLLAELFVAPVEKKSNFFFDILDF